MIAFSSSESAARDTVNPEKTILFSRIALGFLTLAGLYLRYRKFLSRNLWSDEMQELAGVHRSLREMLTHFVPGEPGGFPGDYLLMWPLGQVTSDKWILALPHIVATLFGYYFLYRICLSKFRSLWPTLLAFGMYSFNRDLIFHAFEIRPYAVLPTLALGFYWFSQQAVRHPLSTFRSKILWAVAIGVVLLFHFYGCLIVSVVLLYRMLFLKGKQEVMFALNNLAGPTAVGILAASPFWIYYFSHSLHREWFFNTFEYTGHTPVSVLASILGTLGDLSIRFAWLFPFMLILGTFGVRDESWPQRVGAFGLLILFPIAFILTADYRGSYWLLARQYVWVMPLWALLAAESFQALLGTISTFKK